MTSGHALLYFAYGSNMDAEQMHERCPGATMVGRAALGGHRFLINSRGVATVAPVPYGEVWGVLWNVTEENLESLDRYEGVRAGLYSRAVVEVVAERGPVQAITYVAADATDGPPREDYLVRIVMAARAGDLPGQYIEQTLIPYAKREPRSAP